MAKEKMENSESNTSTGKKSLGGIENLSPQNIQSQEENSTTNDNEESEDEEK